MAVAKLNNKKIDVKLISSDTLRGSFSALEEIVNQDAVELATIDADIRALQSSLKALKFDGDVLATSEIDLDPEKGEALVYDYQTKIISFFDGEKAIPLLNLPAKQRKQIHTYFLSDLLTQVGADYKEAKAKE